MLPFRRGHNLVNGCIKRLFNYVLLSVKEQTLKLQRKIGKQFVTRENISGYCGCGPLLCPPEDGGSTLYSGNIPNSAI